MSREAFIDYHRNHHAPLFMSIPETKQYVRKYVVSHPVEIAGFPSAPYDSITDIYFSTVEDYHAFFGSENYKTKVHPDEPSFFKLDEVVMSVCDEMVVADL